MIIVMKCVFIIFQTIRYSNIIYVRVYRYSYKDYWPYFRKSLQIAFLLNGGVNEICKDFSVIQSLCVAVVYKVTIVEVNPWVEIWFYGNRLCSTHGREFFSHKIIFISRVERLCNKQTWYLHLINTCWVNLMCSFCVYQIDNHIYHIIFALCRTCIG